MQYLINKISLNFDQEFPMKIKYISEDTIFFKNGLRIRFYHDSECCENNFADLTALNDTNFMDYDFSNLNLEVVDYGFKLNEFFIPCYSWQNGYYSNNVDAILHDEDGLRIVMTTEAKEEEV